MAKLKVYHFHNGSGGGVLSVIRNLLLYNVNNEIENHVIYTINRKQVKDFKIPCLKGATSEQVFSYTPNWNFYYTSKQLAKLLPDDNAIIIAHDLLELGMVSNLGLQNRVIYFLHGNYEYYYDLAIKHNQWIDCFICIAAAIEKKLLQLLPARLDSIVYKRFPVPDIKSDAQKSGVAKAVFIGRCEKAKGIDLLPKIAEQLANAGVEMEWHIIGEGSLSLGDSFNWPTGIKLLLHGVLENEELLQLLPLFDYLILPSLAEGMPVSVIEAMKAGVIPIVNDLAGGLQELVINGKTGYRIKGNEVNGYVIKIIELEKAPEEKKIISFSASQLSQELFNPKKNTKSIEQLYYQLISSQRQLKTRSKIYGSRLDEKWIPNFITYTMRKILNL